MKVLCSQEVVNPHLCGVVPCQVTAKASAPQVQKSMWSALARRVRAPVPPLVVLLRGGQRLVEIPQEVIQALQADGNTDHIRADAGGDLLLIG